MGKIAWCLCFFIFFSACSQNEPPSKNTIQLARVDDYYLTLDEATASIPHFMLKQDSIKALKNYRQDWIREKLLLQKATELNLANQPTVQQKLEKARQRVLTDAVSDVVLSKFEKEHSITDQEALRYYQDHKEQFVLQEQFIRFRHLSTESIENARLAREELQSGTAWSKVAKQYSEEAEQRIQQSKKYWPASVVLNDFSTLEQYVASLDSSEISPVRRINGTYHFIQLMDRRAEGSYAKPQWIVERLKNWLLVEKKNRFFNSYVKNLYLKAKEDNEMELYNVLKKND